MSYQPPKPPERHPVEVILERWASMNPAIRKYCSIGTPDLIALAEADPEDPRLIEVFNKVHEQGRHEQWLQSADTLDLLREALDMPPANRPAGQGDAGQEPPEQQQD